MKKRLFSLLLVAGMVFATTTCVFAEDLKGGDGWCVTNSDGDTLSTNFTSEDMSKAASAMQPGDTITYTIDVKNQASDEATIYLRNDILKSFEDEMNSEMGGAYGYTLSYASSTGAEEVFFDSNSLGGNSDVGGVGLHQATVALNGEDYLMLEKMKTGAKGTLTLTVALDGETQGNVYQESMGRLALSFAVEPEVVPKPGKETHIKKTEIRAVNTGDSTNVMPFVILGVCAGVVVLILAIVLLKRNKKEEPDEEA